MEALVSEMLAGLDRCSTAASDTARAQTLAECRTIALRMRALAATSTSMPHIYNEDNVVGTSLSHFAFGGRRSLSGPLLAPSISRRVAVVQTTDSNVHAALRAFGNGLLVVPSWSSGDTVMALADLALQVDIVLFDWPSPPLLELSETSKVSFVALLPTPSEQSPASPKEALLAAHPSLSDAIIRRAGVAAMVDVVHRTLLRRTRRSCDGSSSERLSGRHPTRAISGGPTVGEVAMVPSAAGPDAATRLPAKAFLICDDNDTNMLFAEYLLRKAVPNCTIDLCSDGIYAVQVIDPVVCEQTLARVV